MLIIFSIVSFSILYIGYRFYSDFIEKKYGVSESETTPSIEINDGYDYVPTNKWILLGHHFSSIAGAGPIVGPIMAALYFGWGPAVLWIILGTIFIGGVHDFSSLIISIRHKGKSIAEIANLYINKRTYKVFLIFVWFALMYVVAVFADITASTFSSSPEVSQISVLYTFIALIFGWLNYKYKINKLWLTIFSLLVILIGIYLSFNFKFIFIDKSLWIYALLFYAFIASVLPVWLLLQPRDYLSSYILYFSVIIGILGLFGGGYKISYPSFLSIDPNPIGSIFPFLFVTIACGAISGFHSLVASGTTSKQIDYIKNARFIGYGSMVLEAVVAIIALSTVMILSFDKSVLSLQPAQVYAMGISNFLSLVGVNESIGKVFGFLIVSGFVLTTLDTATRIARYIFQEIVGRQLASIGVRVLATIISLIIPYLLLNLKIKGSDGVIIPCWKIIWPIFGITNQLLAALVLIIIYLWAKKEKIKKTVFILLPAIFMVVTTLYALVLKIVESISSSSYNIVFYIAIILLALSIFVIYETGKSLINLGVNDGT
ncbi:MAG: carbon starvation protein A [Elusimicrobiota bacterium]